MTSQRLTCMPHPLHLGLRGGEHSWHSISKRRHSAARAAFRRLEERPPCPGQSLPGRIKGSAEAFWVMQGHPCDSMWTRWLR